jgi:hypothetical protein
MLQRSVLRKWTSKALDARGAYRYHKKHKEEAERALAVIEAHNSQKLTPALRKMADEYSNDVFTHSGEAFGKINRTTASFTMKPWPVARSRTLGLVDGERTLLSGSRATMGSEQVLADALLSNRRDLIPLNNPVQVRLTWW